MFKRVDRRLKRKAEQEELGIDSELKEALGIPDTDSDESDSDGDSDDSDEDSHEGGLDVEVDEDENAEALSNAGSEDELSERDDPDEIEMTIDQALTNPLYPSPSDPDTTLCFVCPGRQLKASSQIDIHLKSKHHTRRFSQFSDNCKNEDDKGEDARQFVPQKKIEDTVPVEGVSKREQKKLARRASQAQKRKDKKAAFQARQEKRSAAKTATAETDTNAPKTKPKPRPKSKPTPGVEALTVAPKGPPKKKRKTLETAS